MRILIDFLAAVGAFSIIGSIAIGFGGLWIASGYDDDDWRER
jgi:hypothetical protein